MRRPTDHEGSDHLIDDVATRPQPTLEVTEAEFSRCFDVNVKSVFWSVGAAVPQMRKNGGGSIINISSIGSVRPRPGLVWYNASKGAVSNVRRCPPLRVSQVFLAKGQKRAQMYRLTDLSLGRHQKAWRPSTARTTSG